MGTKRVCTKDAAHEIHADDSNCMHPVAYDLACVECSWTASNSTAVIHSCPVCEGGVRVVSTLVCGGEILEVNVPEPEPVPEPA
jgi:hypothetical protein